MSRYEFERMTPEEFGEVYKAYYKKWDMENRERWERTRTLAALILQPYLKKGVTPREILPLLWDKGPDKWKEAQTLTKEEQKRRFEELAKRR